MEILHIKVLRGPNYWSNYRKNLIVMELDLKEYEELPTNLLPGFTENLMELIPSLYTHYCSRGFEGGFLQRLKEGTWLSHVIEHVAIELQSLAGMECGYGRTRSTHKEGVYYIVVVYEVENAGIYAVKAAVKIVENLAKSKPYTQLEADLKKIKEIVAEEGLGVSTKSIISEAKSRNIPYTPLNENALIMLGYGCYQKIILAALTSHTSCIGTDIATDKDQTKRLLDAAYIPTPRGIVVYNLKSLDEAIEELGFPIVIKPFNGNHGRGVTTNINTKEKAIQAFRLAQKISNKIIVEKFIRGCDFRFLVINYKVAAVAKRIPAFVIGDGKSTIKELIDEVNRDPRRGDDHENILTTIKIDKVTLSILDENGLTLESILPKERKIYLKDAANISAGGTAIDVTELLNPYNILLAERIARLMNLDICGIDIIAERIDVPINENNAAVIEVNAAPGLRMHLYSSDGVFRNVSKNIVDMLYPEGHPARIPIVAVTGTNGKTTTVRLIAHLANKHGYKVGFTTTDGITINNTIIYQGDCSGPKSAQAVLRDPLVEYAVLECARGGILRSGLGFDKCSISILMNISEDHLGIDGIETLEELARVKSVVAYSTLEEGYSILNADDDLVYAIKEDLTCNIALFSTQKDNSRIEQHILSGGLAAYIKDDVIVISRQKNKINFMKLDQIPITFNGLSKPMVQNVLAAILAGIASNFKLEDISKWLRALIPSPENIPGRMNLFNIGSFQVLVDYAHNLAAFLELRNYLKQVPSSKKLGIVGVPGDRRSQDIKRIGYHLAQIFDEIIIRHDKDGRGRSNDEISHLLQEGIKQCTSETKIMIISDEQKALEFAINNAEINCLIVYCPEDISKAIHYLKVLEQQKKESMIRSAYDA